MDALIAALRDAEHEGIDPEVYGASLLEQRRKEAGSGFLSRKGFEPEAAATMDMWLTYLYLKFASDLADGVSDLAHADPAWQITPESFDPVDHLERALRDNHIAESLIELTPADAGVQAAAKSAGRISCRRRKGRMAASAARSKLKPGPDVTCSSRARAQAGGHTRPGWRNRRADARSRLRYPPAGSGQAFPAPARADR